MNEAAVHFSKAVQIRGDYAEAHYNLGTIYLRLGRIQEAIDYLSRSLKIDPENSKTHHNLGLAFQQLGNIDEAIGHYKNRFIFTPKMQIRISV